MYSNFHTHTCFCDGKDTPKQLVETAIDLGCRAIGFSGHSYTEFDGNFCMSKENTKKYYSEISSLKREYEGKIKIYLGIEQDIFSTESTVGYDYVIGSAHYVYKNGLYLCIDNTKEIQMQIVDEYYDGDYYALGEDYYATVASVYEKTKCDIIGHFDLITKFNEDNLLFDTCNHRYRLAVEKALHRLMQTKCYFEINSGAVAKGYRKEAYPENWIIDKIKSSGGKVIYTSDCHSRDKLTFGIPKAILDSEDEFLL